MDGCVFLTLSVRSLPLFTDNNNLTDGQPANQNKRDGNETAFCSAGRWVVVLASMPLPDASAAGSLPEDRSLEHLRLPGSGLAAADGLAFRPTRSSSDT